MFHNRFMTIIMKHLPLFGSIDQIEKFLYANKSSGVKYEIPTVKDKYELIKIVLVGIGYNYLDKKEKKVIFSYLKFMTGYSKGQLKRLIGKWRQGKLFYNPLRQRNKFARKYFPSDIALLIKTDVAHECLSGEATKIILKREYEVFRRVEFGNLANISPAHIYNIRNKNRQYNSSQAKFFKRTTARNIDIGIRRKPEPNGRPGYVRVDTVHQGDYLGNKGVYHLNIVDEVTQYELIATVEQITERYLKPVVEALLKLFPFVVFEFHTDNGSEYINRWVVELLNKIHVDLTKSRSRHSNDNALVESKNGSVIRKLYGRNYIDRKWAKEINEFNKNYLNIYLNYHRPCGFAVLRADQRGKIRKKYENWLTPYEKLKSLETAEQYLKPDFSFAKLDKIAFEKSDNLFAEEMQTAKQKLLKNISKNNNIGNEKIK